MLAAKGSIIVRCDQNQKVEIKVNGESIYTGRRYSRNFREKNPVIAYVIDGLGDIKKDSWVLCNYTYMEDGSPYQISDDLFALPLDEEIYGTIDEWGNAHNVFGNIFVERVPIYSSIPVPEDLQKYHYNQGIVAKGGYGFLKGDYLLWLPMSDLEMIYMWNGVERRVIKVYKDEVCGIIKK